MYMSRIWKGKTTPTTKFDNKTQNSKYFEKIELRIDKIELDLI